MAHEVAPGPAGDTSRTPAVVGGRTPETLAGVPRPGDSGEAREFLRGRLALFARVGLLLDTAFFFLLNLLRLGLQDGYGWREVSLLASNRIHLVSCGVFALLSLLTRRRGASRALLDALDAGGCALACASCALVWWADPFVAGPAYDAVIVTSFITIFRSVLVPSPGRRTAWVSAVSCVPTLVLVASILLRPEQTVAGAHPALGVLTQSLWCAVGVAVSTIASRVLYGLREEVRKARRLGQYALLEKIGEGGMGEVWRASHAMLRRPTAIKLLRPDVAGEEAVARFEREVQQTSRLTHPNTIAVFDYGRTPDGVFYYAMEYLPGISLEDLARRFGPLPPARVASILVRVCGSLAEAHAAGLVHRDIKPANILLCERGGLSDVVKVLDFGLVRDLSEGASGDAQAIAGTPLYMAPETARAPLSVDARSDLYAVGAVGYFLLTGAPPFTGRTVGEVLAHHASTPPEPPSRRTGRAVPEDLERLVLACLEKSPARRPTGAEVLGEALRACACLQEWGQREARAWWGEHRASLDSGRAAAQAERALILAGTTMDVRPAAVPAPGGATCVSGNPTKAM